MKRAGPDVPSREVMLAFCGIHGKVGVAFRAVLPEFPQLRLQAGVTHDRDQTIPGVALFGDLEACLDESEIDVVVDFTSAKASLGHARIAIPRGIAMVIGSSGLDRGADDEIDSLCREHDVGVMSSDNLSITMSVIYHAAKLLDTKIVSMEVEDRAPEGVKQPLNSSLWLDVLVHPEAVAGRAIRSRRDGQRLSEIACAMHLADEELKMRHRCSDYRAYARGACLAALNVRRSIGLSRDLINLLGRGMEGDGREGRVRPGKAV